MKNSENNMGIYNLKTNRMLCWDEFLIDRTENAEVRMHKPIKREKVFTCDQEWEGNCCGYATLMKFEGKYRLYYRAQNSVLHPDKSTSSIKASFCISESSNSFEYPFSEYAQRSSWFLSKSMFVKVITPFFESSFITETPAPEISQSSVTEHGDS